MNTTPKMSDMLLVTACSTLTASISGAFNGSLMCLLVVGCHHYGIDPDNIATPIAASLGDLITLVRCV